MNWQEIEEQNKETLDIAQQYAVLYKKEKEKFPYRINVIQELHDDENAHSRILIKLLKYSDSGNFPWLCSFIDKMNRFCNGSFQFEISKPIINTEVYTGNGRIDALIMEEQKYAIIIENKIWDATDQAKQIDRYIMFIHKECNITLDKIFVIYLTKDGSKHISKDSMSDENKENLGNRFIPMSFRFDILPWIEYDIFPICTVKEKCMETAIYQYIDYLKGEFGLLNYQKTAQKKSLQQIFQKMDINESYFEILKQYESVHALDQALKNILNDIGKQLANKFQKITSEFYNNKNIIDFKDRMVIEYERGFYQIFDKKWEPSPDLNVHLEWCNFSYINLIKADNLSLVLHIEGKSGNIKTCSKILLNKAKDRNFEFIKRYSVNTYYRKSYPMNGKIFAKMSEEERRAFLNEIYASDTIQTIIKLMNETIAEMKQQQDNK